jgi:hypothetical protein
MSLEVVNLQVPDLGLVEDLADVVHQTLDGPDPPGGGLECLFPLERAQGAPDPLRPVTPLKSRTP